MSSSIVVYGGNGSLGSSCVLFFKKNGFVCSKRLNLVSTKNVQADVNVIITKRDSLEAQCHEVADGLEEVLNGSLVDGIFCVAGGWVGGSCSDRGFIKSVDTAIKQSIWSSTVAASICPTHLRPGGLFVLCGSLSALNGPLRSNKLSTNNITYISGMIGYGLAKAAVHHLATSLAEPESGMPPDSYVITLLFGTLDTPANRKWMPKADSSTWTSLEFINRLLLEWIQGKMRPKSGSLVQVITVDGKSECIPTSAL
ncbi:unnamed protein product [Taenia asiatica]|uniref:Dihydropteridine reductase n=1 Tax=Taenia asiatica TaxID=60517 RepID=A0A0R3WCJ2_TAEAS|nr:unnamed protein product [Taenia asiatica]